MKFSVIWSQDAADELLEIVAFQKEKYGKKRATEVYGSIREKVVLTKSQPEIGRVVPELAALGLSTIRELIESPWRILYSIEAARVEILSVIDGRRNSEEVLYRKVLEGKLR